jgi:WD40 repeat protein
LDAAKIFKFLIKHGIGAPGPMAVTQAKVYLKLRQANPDATESEILRTMFMHRATTALATGSKEMYYEMAVDPTWVDSVVRSNPDLLSMTMFIIMCEHQELRTQDPRVTDALFSSGLTQNDILGFVANAVTEALDKHAPIWRKHDSGVLTSAAQKPKTAEPPVPRRAALLCRFHAHEKKVNAVLFSPDGNQILSCGDDCTIKVWDQSGGLLMTMRTERAVECLAVSPEGSMVASAGSNVIDLWSVAAGLKIKSFHGHKLPVYTITFHPDNVQVLSADEDVLLVWELQKSQPVHRIACGDDFFSVAAFSPDFRFVAVSGDDRTIRCLDLKAGREWCRLAGHTQQVITLAVSQNGRYLMSGGLDGTARLWDTESRREIRHFTGYPKAIGTVAFLKQCTAALIAGDDIDVWLWDLNSGNSLGNLSGQQAGIPTASFSNDGKRVVSGAYDGTICVWALA